LSTPTRAHDLVPSVRATVTKAPTADAQLQLLVEGPEWQEVITGPPDEEESLRRFGLAIEGAAAQVEAVKAVRETQKRPAEERLAAAHTDLLGIEEAKPLIDRLAGLTEAGERVLDMAPGISTGHDGVLVVTDRRLLFVGLRHKLLLPYGRITAVKAGGRWFGARLTISTREGKSVVSGLPPRHATEIAEFATQHLHAPSIGT